MNDNTDRENARSCWEYWNCSQEAREKCYVYQKDLGGHCWALTPFIEKDEDAPLNKHDFSSCKECPWFKKISEMNTNNLDNSK